MTTVCTKLVWGENEYDRSGNGRNERSAETAPVSLFKTSPPPNPSAYRRSTAPPSSPSCQTKIITPPAGPKAPLCMAQTFCPYPYRETEPTPRPLRAHLRPPRFRIIRRMAAVVHLLQRYHTRDTDAPIHFRAVVPPCCTRPANRLRMTIPKRAERVHSPVRSRSDQRCRRFSTASAPFSCPRQNVAAQTTSVIFLFLPRQQP
mmetsp:Transcript_41462/g.67279  ORF Transcript_41462/g.67279 Transcript_41462/m.67279 type:complete len:203 (+) Transcript_41462:1757-2365(+)